jgi:hypothetical protein
MIGMQTDAQKLDDMIQTLIEEEGHHLVDVDEQADIIGWLKELRDLRERNATRNTIPET